MPEAASNGAGTESPSSLLAQFNAIAEAGGGLVDDPAVVIQPDKGDPEPAEPAKAEPGKAPSLAEAVDPTEPAKEPAKEKQQATKPADWAALREEKRQARAWVEAKKTELATQQSQLEARLKVAEATSPEKLRSHLESGNFDELAKVLGAKDWNDLNDQAARQFSDPSYKQNRAMKDEVERMKAERAEEKRQRDEAEAEQQRQHAEREFVGYVDSSLKAAEHPDVKGLSADPNFTNAVYGHMSAHYRQTGEQLDPEEAATQMLPGIRAHYEHLHKIFGVQATVQQPEATQVVTPDRAGSKQPARQTNKVARTRAAGGGSSSGELSHAEFIKMGAREMEKALDTDIRENKF